MNSFDHFKTAVFANQIVKQICPVLIFLTGLHELCPSMFLGGYIDLAPMFVTQKKPASGCCSRIRNVRLFIPCGYEPPPTKVKKMAPVDINGQWIGLFVTLPTSSPDSLNTALFTKEKDKPRAWVCVCVDVYFCICAFVYTYVCVCLQRESNPNSNILNPMPSVTE